MKPIPKIPQEGYRALSTGGLNLDRAALNIGGGTEDGQITLLRMMDIFPENITLKARIHPVPIPSLESKISLTQDGMAFSACSLYADAVVSDIQSPHLQESRYQALSLIYDQSGTYMQGRQTYGFKGLKSKDFQLGIPEGTLYHHEFEYVKEAVVKQKNVTTQGQNLCIFPMGVVNTRVLRPYGGCFSPHLPPAFWQQTYYEIDSQSDKTTFNHFTAETLAQSGVFPGSSATLFGQSVLFYPTSRLVFSSFEEAILKRKIEIFLIAGNQKKFYHCQSIQHINHTFLAEITFIPY